MSSSMDQVRDGWQEWLQSLSRVGWQPGECSSLSGLRVEPLYSPIEMDTQQFDYMSKLGFPGHYPFTRGVRASGYRGRLWTVRQVAGFHTPVETNQRLKLLIEQGQTGINVVFDQPTQFTLDSDHPLSVGEVGKVGVPIDSLADMEDLFDGIDLRSISVSLITNSGWTILPFYLALTDKRGIPRNTLTGSLQDDPLLVFHSCGTFTIPIRPALHLLTDLVEFCSDQMPRWNTITVAGYNTREAGASAVQEAAFSLSSAIEYAKCFAARGLDVDRFAPRMAFFLSAHNDFFEEIAKFRAMRRIWAHTMRYRFGAKDARSCLMRFHTQTAGSALTAQQPLNNIVRVTMQALSAILGGTQSLHTNGFDEALSIPTEESAILSMRTQQIIAYETGVTNTIDPLGGSYFLESLTDQFEAETRALMDRIEELGGMAEACEAGWVQREKMEYAERYYREVESGKRVVVGVNRFVQATEPNQLKLFEVDHTQEEQQLRRLREVKTRRDNAAVERALAELRAACESGANVMEPAIRAAAVYATLGEVGGVYKSVFGEQRELAVNARLI